jgi:predicted RNase H-like nuclease
MTGTAMLTESRLKEVDAECCFRGEVRNPMFVAGVDGCRAGWIAFKVELPSLVTSVEVVDLSALLPNRPSDLAFLAIDIPIGLLDGSRACDKAARKLLGQPRGTSVFAAPCRAALVAKTHAEASAINQKKMGTMLSLQSFHFGPKIKQVDDAMTPDSQQWAFEVHPEVCFWALNGERPMVNKKKKKAGFSERLDLLSPIFLEIQRHLSNRPSGVAKDDLLDAAAAKWSALRRYRGEASCVCTSERDEKKLEVTICY